MRVTIHGARGSTPAPGADFVRYGGHTSCVALAHREEPASLVLDAGTGLRHLSAALGGDPFRGTILLGHLHWDHTQGLPFFRAGDRPDSSTRLLLPTEAGGGRERPGGSAPEQQDAVAILERCMSPPHFPIGPTGLRGDWTFEALRPGHHDIEGFAVLALRIPHKGGVTFGYRVTDGVATVAYLSDHHPLGLGPGPDGWGEYHDAALRLVADADLVVHDAQFRGSELAERAWLGHSAAEYAVALAERGGARAVVLFHHDPDRTDVELDAEARRWAEWQRPVVAVGAEGMVIDLTGADTGASTAAPVAGRVRAR